MKGFIKFVVLFTGIVILSAFLSPILFDFLPYKFERIFNRLIMIFSLVAIVAFVRIRKETLVKYGLLWKKQSASLFLTAFFTSVVVLSVVFIINLFVGRAAWQPNLNIAVICQAFLKSLISALAICIIEEFFFRGFIFQTVRDKLKFPLILALLATSLFYALLHFVDRAKPFIGPDPTFRDGLTLAGAPFASLMQWQHFWPEAAGLFIFGLMLNLIFLKSNSLYGAMGMHAGCVFFVKLDGTFIDFFGKPSLFWGTAQIYDGALGWAFIFMLGLVLIFLSKKDEVSNGRLS